MCYNLNLAQLQMYATSKFCHYNMLNHHFFGGDGAQSTYRQFLGADRVAVLVDPPFGIMVEALAATLTTIQQQWAACHGERPVSLSFPIVQINITHYIFDIYM